MNSDLETLNVNKNKAFVGQLKEIVKIRMDKYNAALCAFVEHTNVIYLNCTNPPAKQIVVSNLSHIEHCNN